MQSPVPTNVFRSTLKRTFFPILLKSEIVPIEHMPVTTERKTSRPIKVLSTPMKAPETGANTKSEMISVNAAGMAAPARPSTIARIAAIPSRVSVRTVRAGP